MEAVPIPGKRKAGPVEEEALSKRLKHELEREEEETGKEEEENEERENDRPVRSPWIRVNQEQLQEAVTKEQLMELLHYSALGKTKGVKKPSWCVVHKQRQVKAVNVAVVEGVSQRDFYEHVVSLPNLRNKYSTRLTFSSSSENLVSQIFSSEVTVVNRPPKQKEENDHLPKALRCHPVVCKYGTQRRGLTAYLLSSTDMGRYHYPLKGQPGCEDYMSTDCDEAVTDSSPLYGLDCEMCLTDQGNELTRVSLVDNTGTCVLDQLVRPGNKIINFLTRFSGVTSRMLRGVHTTLRQVQDKLKTVLPRNAVLVGHSLDNDLRALKMIHPHVIDTSLLYRGHRGQKFKLKVLADVLLNKQIQREDQRGHDPSEDAQAALELAQYFIKTGPLQVVEKHIDELWGDCVREEEPKPAPPKTTRLSDALQSCGRSVAFLGKRSDLELSLGKQQWFTSDKQIVSGFRAQSKCPFFSVVQFLSGHSLPPPQVYTPLTHSCVVYAGPLSPGVSQRKVRRLFCCCGPVHSVRLIHNGTRVHAEVQFELLESAVLAVSAMNGLTVQDQVMKVQRPVNEWTLDIDLTLDCLKGLNSRLLFVSTIKHQLTKNILTSTKINGHTQKANHSPIPVKVNGLKTETLTEESLRDAFRRFGHINRIILPHNTRRQPTHAYIEFESGEERQTAIASSSDLLKNGYLLCPSLTPLHLSSWRSLDATLDHANSANNANKANTTEDSEMGGEESQCTQLTTPERSCRLRRLDQRVGKLFRSLPDSTLSVVILRGDNNIPGLCFLEIKQEF